MLVELNNIGLTLNKKVILEEVQLNVQPGEIVTLIGPNGAGKSSLLKVILGIIKPTTGNIKVKPNIRIGYMPQALHLGSLLPLSVKRFLELSPRANPAKMLDIVKDLGIEALLNNPINAISGGEMQRVLLARALLNQPELLILDEPAQGVDISGQDYLYRLIISKCRQLNCALVMVSHDLHLVIAGTNKVVCLNKHICCSGLPETITKTPEFIQMFGDEVAKGLAVYTHRHDHCHD